MAENERKPARLARFRAKTTDLRDAIKTVSPFVPRETIPALTCFLLQVGSGTGCLSYRHTEFTVSVEFDAGGEGAALLPIRPLAAFIAAAPGENVEAEYAGDPVALSSGALQAKVIPLPASDAVEAFEVKTLRGANHKPIALAEGVFSWLIDLAIPCMSSEETRYYLNGTNFEVAAGKLHTIATDGHRLGHREIAIEGGHPDVKGAIIPRLTMIALRAAAKGKEVFLRLTDDKASLQFGRATVVVKLIDGPFPDWRRVVPQPERRVGQVTLAGADLATFFRSVKGFNPTGYAPGVKLSIDAEGRASFAGGVDGLGRVTLACEGRASGQVQDVGMNFRYLEAAAASLKTKRLRFELVDSESPMVLKDDASPGTGYVVLMPMRV